MKRIFLLLICTELAGFAYALERPDEIPARFEEVKPNTWYAERFDQWKVYLEQQPEDIEGWLHYYVAAKYAGKTKEVSESIATTVQQRFPGTYSDHVIQFSEMGWTDAGVSHLENAIRSEPMESDHYAALLAEYKLARDERKVALQRLYQNNRIYPSTLNYGYNVLMSVGEKGLLFVRGENTTLPLWILQSVMGIRSDVEVLNTDLLGNPDYQYRKLTAMGLEPPKNPAQFLTELPRKNPNRDFYFALTMPGNDYAPLRSDLYVVGLASRYDGNSDHNQILKTNIEQNFLIDYLSVDFSGEPKTATGKIFSTNYIVPFMLMREYYASLDPDRAAYWESRVRTLAEDSHLKTRIELLLSQKEEKQTRFVPVKIEHKKWEKQMVKVKGNIYVSKFETTNADFEFFLNYLKTNGFDELHDQYAYDLEGYDNVKRSMFTAYHYSGDDKSEFASYPTMDITHDAARAFCEWLTYQYNSQDGRRYKEVRFRLPTQNEWTMAALGYKDFQSWVLEENVVMACTTLKKKKPDVEADLSREKINYSWWGSWQFRNEIQNQFDCYLANVKTPNDVVCPSGVKGDGFVMTGPVGTYFANEMGVFDANGNVAEMIDIRGKAMGGSWDHLPEESTITSVSSYEGPDPTVGFRIFMEIIRE